MLPTFAAISRVTFGYKVIFGGLLFCQLPYNNEIILLFTYFYCSHKVALMSTMGAIIIYVTAMSIRQVVPTVVVGVR